MQKDTFTLWANYNKTVNQKMNEVIKTLTQEEWDKALGGYFKSVRGLCSHLYICDFNWLKFFLKLREIKVLQESFFTGKRYSTSELLFEDKDEYLKMRTILDEKIIVFIDELVYGDFNTYLQYPASEGGVASNGSSSKRLSGGLLMQFFNHGAHHRGMISLYLEMLGHKNNFSSFAAVL